MEEETNEEEIVESPKRYFSLFHFGASLLAITLTVILFIQLIIPIFWQIPDNSSVEFTWVNLLIPIITYVLISLCIIGIIGVFKRIKNYKDEGLILGLIMGFKISLFLGLFIGIAAEIAGVGFITGFSRGFVIGLIIGVIAAISTEFQN